MMLTSFRLVMRVLLVLPVLAGLAGAQERGRGRFPQAPSAPSTPSIWISVGSGFLQMARIDDGRTASIWDFGSGTPITLAVEREISGNFSAGIGGSYARMPLRYTSSGPTANGCTGCDAHATVATYGASFHAGGPSNGVSGLYQALNAFFGVMQFGSFQSDADTRTLAPTSANRDFMFSVGYGFGFAFGQDWRTELGAHYINTVHERDDLPGNAQTLARHYFIHLALRVGL